MIISIVNNSVIIVIIYSIIVIVSSGSSSSSSSSSSSNISIAMIPQVRWAWRVAEPCGLVAGRRKQTKGKAIVSIVLYSLVQCSLVQSSKHIIVIKSILKSRT